METHTDTQADSRKETCRQRYSQRNRKTRRETETETETEKQCRKLFQGEYNRRKRRVVVSSQDGVTEGRPLHRPAVKTTACGGVKPRWSQRREITPQACCPPSDARVSRTKNDHSSCHWSKGHHSPSTWWLHL